MTEGNHKSATDDSEDDFDAAEFRAMLYWVMKNLPKKQECSVCGLLLKEKPVLCNVKPRYNTETYTRDLENWYYACYSCALKSGNLDDY